MKNPSQVNTPGETVMSVLHEGSATREAIQSRLNLSTSQIGGALMGLLQQGLIYYRNGEFSLVGSDNQRDLDDWDNRLKKSQWENHRSESKGWEPTF